MKYYISINSWNLLESFATESLSPFAFYNKRNFGNNLKRYMNNANDKINFLVLSSNDNGGDYTIEIDDAILDKTCIKAVKNLKTLFIYNKTIYYKVGQVAFRFANQSLLDALIAETQILFEIKCIEKYKSYFFVKDVKEKKASVTLKRLGESFSFEQQDFIYKDNIFNAIKGAIVGYVRGELTASGFDAQRLISMIKDIKNSFAGLNTQIMVNDIEITNPEIYIKKIHECKELFNDTCPAKTNNFDILIQLFLQIKDLSSLRYSELMTYKSNDWMQQYEKMISQKQDFENQIYQIESDYDIILYKEELHHIKELEKSMGEQQGKSRVYFKKGTPEYARKNQLKETLKKFEDNNEHYKNLLIELNYINQKIINSSNRKSQYDNVINALFLRASDITNDLLKKFDTVKSLNNVDLAPLKYFTDGMIQIQNERIDKAEIDFFNILLRIIIKRNSQTPISDAYILTLIENAAKEYKSYNSSTTDNGMKIIACLREYWKYKQNKVFVFTIPKDMPVFQSIIAFFLKPFGYDQIERYMLNKKLTEKKYAMMLWGAYNGYAALPKTFTSILYQHESYYTGMDDLLQITYNSL